MTPLIYALYDPRDGRARYVGYTKNFANRMGYHYRDTKRKLQCSTQPWLLELAELGMLPVGRIIEKLEPGVSWEERERFWIAHFKAQWEPLLNETGGGYGTLGRRWTLSPERCQQISKRNKQVWLNRTPEQKQAALDILKANWKPWSYKWEKAGKTQGEIASEKRWAYEELRIKHSERMKKRWEKWRAERGITGTWEERRKKPGGHRGGWDRMTPEKKVSSQAGLATGRYRKGQRHPWREESRQKVSEASSRYWANKPIEEKMGLVKPMLTARKSAWAVLTPDERRARMAKAWAGQKHNRT